MSATDPIRPEIRRSRDGSSDTWHRLDNNGHHGTLGHQLVTRVTGPDDYSPVHHTYPTGYDSRCGWCWLGVTHSEDEHARKVST